MNQANAAWRVQNDGIRTRWLIKLLIEILKVYLIRLNNE